MRFTKAKTKHVVHFLGSHGLAALWCWGRPTFWVASPARSEEMWSFPTYVACVGQAVQKRMNRSICHLAAASCGLKKPSIRWHARCNFMGFCLGSNSDECKDECTPSTPPEWWGAGVVICLEQGADLHMAQLMPLPLTVSCFSKIQIGLPFWYRLTRYQKGKKGR